MKLTDIDFLYSIADHYFCYINYKFHALPEENSADEFIGKSKQCLEELKHILDEHYTEFSKREGGIIASSSMKSSIKFGYEYFGHDSSIPTQLRYDITLSPDDIPENLKLELNNYDRNLSRVLKVYDSIMSMPNLEISKEASLQAGKIARLRKSKSFELRQYLEHTQA
jgi:hypothetical protein